jgi:hypothetical protein
MPSKTLDLQVKPDPADLVIRRLLTDDPDGVLVGIVNRVMALLGGSAAAARLVIRPSGPIGLSLVRIVKCWASPMLDDSTGMMSTPTSVLERVLQVYRRVEVDVLQPT